MSEPGPRRLVLLRHGRTAWNHEGRGQGHADIELDDVGRGQAEAAAEVLARESPVRLWSSDLARAMGTAAYVAEATGLDVVPDPRLREYDLGDRTGLTLAEYAERYPAEHEAWSAGRSAPVVPGAETRDQVRTRLVPALRECLDALRPGETGVAVVHGASVKVGLASVLGWPDDAATSLRGMDNGAWAVVADDGHDGRLRLGAYNRSAGFASREPVG